MNSTIRAAMLIAVAGVATPALAQDSVSKNGTGLPGDALDSYDASSQVSRYAVNLARRLGSWPDSRFGMAPVIRASRTSDIQFDSLQSHNAISRDMLLGVNTNATYDLWYAQGEGINATENDAPSSSVVVNGPTNQFAVTFNEFSTDADGFNHNAVISGIVNQDPRKARQLLVTRVVSAVGAAGSDDGIDSTSSIGLGTIDANGNVVMRADNDGVSGPFFDSNYFMVDNSARTGLNQLGVVSGSNGSTDTAASSWLLRNSGDGLTPAIVPASSTGGLPAVAANSFNATAPFIHGNSFPLTADTTQLGAGTGSRGNYMVSSLTYAETGGIATGASIVKEAATDERTGITIAGLDANGDVTNAVTVGIPQATLTNPATGLSFNFSVPAEFGHVFGQTPFRGGNGPVALGFDSETNEGLVAATVFAFGSDATDPAQAIILGRFDPTDIDGTIAWELVAFTSDANASFDLGSPIYGDFGNDGAAFTGPMGVGDAGEFDGVLDLDPMSPTFDAPIGKLLTAFEVTQNGGTIIFGPSISPPAFDAKGNVYFAASVGLNKVDNINGGTFVDLDSAIIRARYDEATGGWRNELLLELGDTTSGINSGTDYQINFLGVANSLTTDSGTIWSDATTDSAFNGINPASIDRDDPRAFGGLVARARIIYDVNDDGNFELAAGNNAVPGTPDESYNALLYLGYLPRVSDVTTDGSNPGDTGFGIPDESVTISDLTFFVEQWVANDAFFTDITTDGANPGDPGFLIPDGAVSIVDLTTFVEQWINQN
ncbi:MAG: GC-type dockerin domain-anchored protein [Planctomycetota bacterium]